MGFTYSALENMVIYYNSIDAEGIDPPKEDK